VKLMPPIYVKAYVKRGKTDAADAEAICEAVSRPTMRFVAIKSPEQQSILALHRTRDLLVRQRTQPVNMMRAQLAEFGIVLAKGIQHALRLARQLVEGLAPNIPPLAVKVAVTLAEQMANRLDRGWGRAEKCPGRHSPQSRVAPDPRKPSGPAVTNTASTGRTQDCT
jgi:transposase